MTEELVQQRYAMSTGKNYEAQLKRKEAPRPKPIHDELRNLKVKTLILWGGNDRGVTLERAMLLFQIIPDADLHIFAKCAHWVQWDQRLKFQRLVIEFLDSSNKTVPYLHGGFIDLPTGAGEKVFKIWRMSSGD